MKNLNPKQQIKKLKGDNVRYIFAIVVLVLGIAGTAIFDYPDIKESSFQQGVNATMHNETFINQTMQLGYYNAIIDIRSQLGTCREIKCSQPNPYLNTIQYCMECFK